MKSLLRSRRAVITDGILTGVTGWVTEEQKNTVEMTFRCGTTAIVPRIGVQMISDWADVKCPTSKETALELLRFGSERDVLRHREAIAQFFMHDSVISTNRHEIRQKHRIAQQGNTSTDQMLKDALTCPSCEAKNTFAGWYMKSSDDQAICPSCDGVIGYEEFAAYDQETARRLKTG